MFPWMVLAVVLLFVLLIVLFVLVVATRPADFSMERSANISAPPSKIFAKVNDFHHWDGWSPWAKLDPAMRTVFEGPSSGTGASYKWYGNRQVGEGAMTIMESRPDDYIRVELRFLKPFKATNFAEFTFAPRGRDTEVTWRMTGKRSFILKAFALFMDMEKLIGPQFEQGLANLKTLVESEK